MRLLRSVDSSGRGVMGLESDFPAHVRRQLQQHIPEARAEWDARPAAVLIPLYREDSAWRLLFTRRTEEVESHQGQVSFPGGLVEDTDTDVEDAALREAWEEIGLQPEEVEILGKLAPMFTVTQFRITPVVGLIQWPFELRLQRTEVARAFGVPIEWLSEAANLETEYRKPMIPGPEIPVYHFKPYDGEVIWGATARITLDFLELIQVI